MIQSNSRPKTTISSLSLFCCLLSMFSLKVHGQECSILSLNNGTLECIGDQYRTDILIQFNEFTPQTGDITIQVNDSLFDFPVTPNTLSQLVTIIMPYDGQQVSVEAYFSEDSDCRIAMENLFTAPSGCGMIGDTIWNDLNFDGIKDQGEPGLSNIPVSLMDCENNLIEQVATNENGAYAFSFLEAGSYLVNLQLPNDGGFYEFSPKGAGTDPERDSNFDEFGNSECVELEEGAFRKDIDGGIIVCPPLNSLICNNRLNITLKDNCEQQVFPEMILEGNYPCYSALEVRLFDDNGFIGDVLTGDQLGKTVTAIVLDQQSEVFCSGEIEVFDLREPVIDCAPRKIETAKVPKAVQFLKGSLENGDATYQIGDFSCWYFQQVPPTANDYFYNLNTFQVDQTDIYNFIFFTDWGEGAAAILDTEFNLDNPCRNLMISELSDEINISFDQFDAFGADLSAWVEPGKNHVFNLPIQLQAGRTYELVTSSFAPLQTGNFTWAIYSDQGGKIIPISDPDAFGTVNGRVQYDLLCTDQDSIFNNINSLDVLGQPTVIDNCDSDPTLTFEDIFDKTSVCGTAIIGRTFTAVDASGNTDTCRQELFIRKPIKEEIILPSSAVFLNCDDNFATDDNGHPHPNESGFPFIWTATGIKPLMEPYCNIVADYSDEIRVDVCEGGYILRREWTVINWCNIASTVVYNQFIHVEDRTGPELDLTGLNNGNDFYPDTLRFSTSAFACTADFLAPLPTITDNCSNSWTILTEVISEQEVPIIDFGIQVGTELDTLVLGSSTDQNFPVLLEIPLGCHWLRYTVTDDCGNISSETYPICIEDRVEPIAICENDISVSIGGQGLARLFATNVDQGSSDACGIEKIEIRRVITKDENCDPIPETFSPYGEYVDFDCCDAGELIRVELRVTDLYGNTNTCWSEILIEDKIRPICEAPLPMSIKCVDLPSGFEATDTLALQSLFGNATGSDNCEVVTTTELTPAVNLDDCGFGTISRQFTVADKVGNRSTNTCTQVVTILPEYHYEIRFPQDIAVECGMPEPDTILTNNLGCGLIAVRVEDEVFEADQDGCFKTFRTYTVINWCEYEELAEPVRVGRDEDCDSNPGDEAVWVLRRPDGAFIDRDDDETNNVPLLGTKGTNCDGNTNPEGYWEEVVSTGMWVYTQLITVYDNTPPAITYQDPDPFCSIDNDNCTGMVEIPFQIEEICSSDDLTINVFFDENRDTIIDQIIEESAIRRNYPNFSIQGNFRIGNHLFRVEVTDGCGNSGSFELPFSIVDCKAPAFLCSGAIVSPLSPIDGEQRDVDGDGIEDRGFAVFRPADFLASTTPDCSGEVKYSINRFGALPNPDQDSVILTCRDTVFARLEIYAWDSANNPYSIQPDSSVGGPNYNRCEVFAGVEDSELELCNSIAGEISGVIRTSRAGRLGGVEVQLSGQLADMQMTGPNGVYRFESLPEGKDYTVAPLLDIGHNNGVSTLDIIIISNHILGVAPIETPYEIIAADANNSKNISTLDIIKLRKLILGVDRRLQEVTSWRFIDAAYEFPIPGDPWFEPLPEAISINNLGGQGEWVRFHCNQSRGCE